MRRRLFALVVAASLAAASVGCLAISSGQGEPPTPEPSPTPPPTPAATSEPVRPPEVVQSASPDIVHPPELADLPGNIWALAADAATGDLWFPILGETAPPFQGLGPRIYRYSPASGKLDFWELPIQPYTGSVLDMTLDGQGNVWLAWGYNIVKFGTATLSATAYPVDKDVQYPRAGASDADHPVTALAVDSTGTAWFTRYNDAAILELDPTSGAVREHAVPAHFAPPIVAHMEMDAQGRLWLPGAVPLSSDSADQLGEFDTASGDFTLHDVPVLALTVGKDGQIWLTGGSEGGLQKFDSLAGQASLVADVPLGGPLEDCLAADPKTGNLWLSSFGEGKIGMYSPRNGETTWYSLPIVEYNTTMYAWSVPYGVDLPSTVKVRTEVNAMAVDINGNLWFAHGSTIGMIPAP
jgi:streptogramin lyase